MMKITPENLTNEEKKSYIKRTKEIVKNQEKYFEIFFHIIIFFSSMS